MNGLGSGVLQHLVVTIAASILPAIVKGLNEGTLNLPTVAVKFRLAIIMVVTALATAVDQAQNGADLWSALAAAAVAGGPALLVELVHAIFGGWGGGGTSSGIKADDVKAAIRASKRPPAGYSTPMTALALAVCVGVAPGCGALQNVPAVVKDVSNEIITDAQDGKAIVDALHSTVSIFFLLHPDAVLQAKVEQAFSDVNLALDVAIRASTGARSASDNEYDLAFANFRAAYADLTKILSDLGVLSTKMASEKMSVARGGGGIVDMPIPRASIARVKK